MTVQDRDKMMQDAKRSILRSVDAPIAPATLIDHVAEQGIDEYFIRAAIWFLIDRGKIELTPQRMIVARN